MKETSTTPQPPQVPDDLWGTWTEEARERLQRRAERRPIYFSQDEFWDGIVSVWAATGQAPAPSHADITRDIHGASVTRVFSRGDRFWLCVQMKGEGQADDYQLPLAPAEGAIRGFWWTDFTSPVRSAVIAVLVAREMVWAAKQRARGSGLFAFLKKVDSPEVVRLEEGLRVLEGELRVRTGELVGMMVGEG